MLRKPTVKVKKPLFEMWLKDTIITTATWITASQVIAGCANGMFAIWDLNYLNPENGKLVIYCINQTLDLSC